MKEASCAAPQADAAIEKVKEASGTADAGTADGEGDSSLPGAAVTEKAVEASGNAAADADVDGKAEHSSLPSVSDAVSSTEDKPAAVTEPPLTAEELLKLTERARALVEAGRVFAVQEVKGMLWRSLITLDFGRLHLYFLQGLSIPDNAHTVQMSDVVPVAPPCEVFLDVLCPGTPLRRVSVSLPRDTPFGRQFLLMCSGQRGVSYANTKLFKVWHKNRQGESVWGGDYQDNNGRKGAALLPDLDNSDQYWPSCKVGSIWPPGFGPRQSTQFSVITRECDPDDGFPIIFAEVVRGIEVFQEAATYKPVNNVVIQQCGVLLSQ